MLKFHVSCLLVIDMLYMHVPDATNIYIPEINIEDYLATHTPDRHKNTKQPSDNISMVYIAKIK